MKGASLVGFLFVRGLHMADTGYSRLAMDIHEGHKREQHKLNLYPGDIQQYRFSSITMRYPNTNLSWFCYIKLLVLIHLDGTWLVLSA